MRSSRWRHAGAALFFAVLAVPMTWPFALQLATHVPGTGPDDNLQLFWDFWWMRQALSSGLSGFFHTPFMFHPSGIDLVLHTHVALNAFVGATLLGWTSTQAALNLTIIASCALNGFATYLLAYRTSSHWPASIVAGIFFAAHPSTTKHLFGHFGIYSGWCLAFFAYALLEALEQRGWRWPLLAGVLLAAVAYVDYYLFVYACAFVACVLAHRWLGLGVRMSSTWLGQSHADYILAVIAILCAAIALTIALTGGLVASVGPVPISLRTGTNLRALSAVAALWWAWRRRRPMLTINRSAAKAWPDVRVIVAVGLVCAVLIAPILQAAFFVWRAGEDVSQTYWWRSAPAGLDPGAIVLGNPFNAFWGAQIMRLYASAGMSAFDGPFWLGVAPIVLFATRASWTALRHSRLWLTVVSVFFVWALGPYLLLFGVNTGLPLPGILLRYLPIVSNARLPARADVFVTLGAAVLLAIAIASSRRRLPTWRVVVLAAIVLGDFWAAPLPMYRLDAPPIYTQLAGLPMGGVLEIPFGIRDSFGEEGRIDSNVLYYQSVHGKPLAGGYIARVPPSVKSRYHDAPVFNALLRLSAGEITEAPPIAGRDAADFLTGSGITYIVVDRRIATRRCVTS